jgi:murein DD-endopeptidase MepM/ murein hydrolase activator NlpD
MPHRTLLAMLTLLVAGVATLDLSKAAWAAPITLWTPFPSGQRWRAGGTGSYYDQGYHKGKSYWAVDFNEVNGNDYNAPICAAANGTIKAVHYVRDGNVNCGWAIEVQHEAGYYT